LARQKIRLRSFVSQRQIGLFEQTRIELVNERDFSPDDIHGEKKKNNILSDEYFFSKATYKYIGDGFTLGCMIVSLGFDVLTKGFRFSFVVFK
jgi:hypothetical protein